MSVGGFMALEFALAHPERLNGLILIAATSKDYTAEEREAYHRQFDKLDIDGMVPRDFAEWVAPFCFGETTMFAPQLAIWPSGATTNSRVVGDLSTGSANALGGWRRRCRRARCSTRAAPGSTSCDDGITSGALRPTRVPALVIHGEEDKEDMPLPIDRAAAMAEADALPDATFARVAEAGHSVNLEQPAVVNAAIARFLGRLDLS